MRGRRFALCPDDVGIILSYLCGSGCQHCLYNCGPLRDPAPMSAATLRAALEAVALLPGLPQVHLTGGEPFLHFDLLVEGARMARELGIVCYVETSGAWCRDRDRARERFAALREAGLSAVLVSCSPFHAEHIPPARTLTAVEAAADVFGESGVIVYLPEFVRIVARFGLEQPTPLARYIEALGATGASRLLWEGYGLIPGGRSGYRLGHLAPHHSPEAFAGETCAAEILYAPHSHLDLYGNFVPGFCGGLTVGDWRALPQVLSDFQAGRYPPLVAELVARGPFGLFELAQREHEYEPLDDGYVGKCHLCVDVRRRLAGSGDHAELRPREFYEHF